MFWNAGYGDWFWLMPCQFVVVPIIHNSDELVDLLRLSGIKMMNDWSGKENEAEQRQASWNQQ